MREYGDLGDADERDGAQDDGVAEDHAVGGVDAGEEEGHVGGGDYDEGAHHGEENGHGLVAAQARVEVPASEASVSERGGERSETKRASAP